MVSIPFLRAVIILPICPYCAYYRANDLESYAHVRYLYS